MESPIMYHDVHVYMFMHITNLLLHIHDACILLLHVRRKQNLTKQHGTNRIKLNADEPGVRRLKYSSLCKKYEWGYMVYTHTMLD